MAESKIKQTHNPPDLFVGAPLPPIRHCWRMLNAADTRCRQRRVSSAASLEKKRDGQSKAKSLLLKPNALLVGTVANFEMLLSVGKQLRGETVF